MKVDRAKLINAVRTPLFNGAISLEQATGITAICDEWDLRDLPDQRFLADMLGQGYWESDQTMQPVREAYYMGEPAAEDYRKTLHYYPFYGRGVIQNTWEDNYRKMTALLGARFSVDFVKTPDAMLRMDCSIASMFEGMLRGIFTGAKLSDYFSGSLADWVGSRHIVNGSDHADQIANICRTFWSGLGGPAYIRELHMGDVGDDVKLAQDALQVQGFLTGTADGVFGPATRMAVYGFQRSKNLDVDGVIGPQTRVALLGTDATV